MGLLSGGGAALLDSIFAPLYLNGVIYKQEIVQDDGGDTVILYVEYDAKVQVDSMDERMRSEEGAASEDRRIIVLANSTNAIVDTDCEIAALEGPYANARFQVASVNSDPCGAYRECRGRRA
jgi:hypothetical protein